MKHRMLALVGLFVSLGFLLQLYGCETKEAGTYPVTQIKFYVDDTLYVAVTVSGNGVPMPSAPKKEGYDFKGWFYDAKFTEEFDAYRYACDRIRTDVELHAKFEKSKTDETLPARFRNFGRIVCNS